LKLESGAIMEDLRFPYTIFDIFVYFLPGFIFTSSLIWLVVPENSILDLFYFIDSTKDFKYIYFFFSLIIFYSIGHIVSSIAQKILEKIFIKNLLGYQTQNLFGSSSKNSCILFKLSDLSDYRKCYSEKFQEKFNQTFNDYFSDMGDHEHDRFMLCFTFVKENCPTTFSRITTFLLIYDFSRNTSLSLLFLGFTLLIKNYFLYGTIIVMIAYLFFCRYLKFYRMYADEIFRTFYVHNLRKATN
jgi:hypothetical protein